MPHGATFEIVKQQYLLQHSNPFRCEIMIQAYPDEHLEQMSGIDLILGQPFLFNHYTIFDIMSGRIGVYKTLYTKTSGEITWEVLFCIVFFTSLLIGGVYGCYRKFSQNKRENYQIKVFVKDKSIEN